tara:strand:+ start:20783 stop:20983 length:201 start_codon:yes stop_codon:yes gene_type:complete
MAMLGKNKNKEQQIMDRTIRVLIWVQFIMICVVLLNHMARGLDWFPLVILIVPSATTVLFEEERWK